MMRDKKFRLIGYAMAGIACCRLQKAIAGIAPAIILHCVFFTVTYSARAVLVERVSVASTRPSGSSLLVYTRLTGDALA